MAGPGTGFDYNDAPRVELGDSGVWVAFLKETLPDLLIDVQLTDDDTFDDATKSAVSEVQGILDLPQDGVADRMTWAMISSYLYLGDINDMPMGEIALGAEGEGVRFLQACLKEHGEYTGEVTGVYDRATRNAVRDFHADVGTSARYNLNRGSWLLLGMHAVMAQIPVGHGIEGGDAAAGDADTDGADAQAAASLAPLAIRGVFLTAVEDGVGRLEVLVQNPNPQAVQYVRVEVVQEHQFNDETEDELAGNDSVTVTIAADTHTFEDGTVSAYGQVRVACLDPTSGEWTDAVEQEFNVGLEADGALTDSGTGASEGPHLVISGFEHADEVTWAGDRGSVEVSITLLNNGGMPVHDATLEISQPRSGGGEVTQQQIDQNVLDVGAESVNQTMIDVPRQHDEVPFHVKVEWAAAAGHGTEHSTNSEFLLRWEGEGRVIGISPY